MSRKKDDNDKSSKNNETPELTQFQKSLLKQVGRKVTVRLDGSAQEITVEEVLARKLIQVATEGSPHALGHATRSVNQAQRLRQALIKEEVEQGIATKEMLERGLARAVREGADPVWIVPHPDDVVILENEGWRFDGPVNEAALKPIREHITLRDILLMQSVLDERLASRNDKCQAETTYINEPGSTSMVFAFLLNGALPARFRLSENEIMFQITRHERLTARQLLKAARKSWASIGQSRRRGWSLPPWAKAGPSVRRLFAACSEVLGLLRSGEISSEQEIAAILSELI